MNPPTRNNPFLVLMLPQIVGRLYAPARSKCKNIVFNINTSTGSISGFSCMVQYAYTQSLHYHGSMLRPKVVPCHPNA